MESHFGHKLRFIFMITGRDFIYYERSRFFMITGDFIVNGEIFMMTGRDFHDDRSRFF